MTAPLHPEAVTALTELGLDPTAPVDQLHQSLELLTRQAAALAITMPERAQLIRDRVLRARAGLSKPGGPPPTVEACPTCGRAVRPEFRFCADCGTALSPQPRTDCPACGAPTRPGLTFCTRCGQRLGPPGPVSPSP